MLEERFSDLEQAPPRRLWEVPFVVVCYIPTRDGITVDTEITGYRGTVAQLRARILRAVRITKWMLEESTRFHGYKNPQALPSIGYRCVRYVTFLDTIPQGRSAGSPNTYFPDYGKIVQQVGGERLVNAGGVKQFWIYHWHHGTIVPIETNMASPVSGDISNSDRTNDLPIFKRTYLVVGVNFTRGPDKHVHNMGHQMEAMLDYACRRQDGNTDLFRRQFCGADANGRFQTGRCGTCHIPPNGTRDYDYHNRTRVLSDIEDWTPQGTGTWNFLTCDTWERLPYHSPTGDGLHTPGTILEEDAWWYLYWFQNFPGRDNHIRHPRGEITDWWRFLGDWDGAIRERYGLWKP